MGEKSLKIKRAVPSQAEAALLYYRLVCAVYDIHLPYKQLCLLAHTAIWGTISTPPARKEFVELYDSSYDSLNNMLSQLQKKKLLVKDKQHKIRVRPDLAKMNFDSSRYLFNINVELDAPVSE